MSIKTDKIQVGKFQWFYRQTEIESDKPNGQGVSPDRRLTTTGDASASRATLRTPVLFLHGLPSHSYTWQKTMSFLADENIPSIAPDWLGCGFSDKPSPRDFAYTPEAFIEELAELITVLELEKFYLAVQGFLGSVGIQYALQNPERVEGLIILNAPISGSAKLPWSMKQFTLPVVGDMTTQDPLLVDRTIEKGSGFVVADEDLDVLRKPFLQSSKVGRALMAIAKKLDLNKSTQEIEAGLSQWNKPILIIWGAVDKWLDVAEVKKLADLNSQITLVELPTAKHYPQEHWASDIAKEIVKFFRRKIF